jgi:hypothetical protein
MIDRALALWSTMFGLHPFWTIVLVLVIFSLVTTVIRRGLKALAWGLGSVADLVADGQAAWRRRRFLSSRTTFH